MPSARSALQQERELTGQLQELLDERRAADDGPSPSGGATDLPPGGAAELRALLRAEAARALEAEGALERERGANAAMEVRGWGGRWGGGRGWGQEWDDGGAGSTPSIL